MPYILSFPIGIAVIFLNIPQYSCRDLLLCLFLKFTIKSPLLFCGKKVPKASFDIFAGSIASPRLKSSRCQLVVHRPDMQFITIFTTGTSFKLQKAALFFLRQKDVSDSFLSEVFDFDVMQNPWPVNNGKKCIFRGGNHSFYSKLRTQAFFLNIFQS